MGKCSMTKPGMASVVRGEQRTDMDSTSTKAQQPSLRVRWRWMPSASAAAPSRKRRKYPRQEEQELMRAGVLDPGEEQQAHDQLAPCQTGQSGQLSLCCKDEAQRDKDEIEQAQPSEVVECLEGQTAAVIVGIAARVVIGEDVGYHGPEQDDHGGDGRKAEEDEVLPRRRAAETAPPFASRTQPATSSST